MSEVFNIVKANKESLKSYHSPEQPKKYDIKWNIRLWSRKLRMWRGKPEDESPVWKSTEMNELALIC